MSRLPFAVTDPSMRRALSGAALAFLAATSCSNAKTPGTASSAHEGMKRVPACTESQRFLEIGREFDIVSEENPTYTITNLGPDGLVEVGNTGSYVEIPSKSLVTIYHKEPNGLTDTDYLKDYQDGTYPMANGQELSVAVGPAAGTTVDITIKAC